MRLTMPKIAMRDDSSHLQFRVKVPIDVRERAKGRMIAVELPAGRSEQAVTVTARVGTHVKFSPRTRDPVTATARQSSALMYLSTVWDAIRSGCRPLTLRQIVALSGDVYRLFLDECGDNPGEVNNWIALKAFNRAVREGRIVVAPALRPDPDYANDVMIAREMFGVDLTAGINAHRSGTPEIAALEARFRPFGQLDLAPSRHRNRSRRSRKTSFCD